MNKHIQYLQNKRPSRIESILDDMDMTQREFAKIHNINHTVLSAMSTGGRIPTFKIAVQIADAMGLKPCDVFDYINICGETYLLGDVITLLGGTNEV